MIKIKSVDALTYANGFEYSWTTEYTTSDLMLDAEERLARWARGEPVYVPVKANITNSSGPG